MNKFKAWLLKCLSPKKLEIRMYSVPNGIEIKIKNINSSDAIETLAAIVFCANSRHLSAMLIGEAQAAMSESQWARFVEIMSTMEQVSPMFGNSADMRDGQRTSRSPDDPLVDPSRVF